jgi:hypothetical protein
MRILLLFLSLVLLSLSASAEELVRTVSLSDSVENVAVRGGDVTEGDALTVTAVPGKQFQTLIELSDPGIGMPVYAVKGMVRYENVEGDGFLQLDNHFGSSGTFFTKSLAQQGPLGKISGSSDWRPFVLPFYANSGDQADGSSTLPEKLSLSLFLPASGTVSISGVGLYQYADGEDPLQPAGQWFSDRTATLFGAIGGSLLGIWGAFVGVIAARGKARGFVVSSATVLLMVGVVCLLIGVAAIASSQPYAVYYPFLLIGVLLVALMAVFRRTLSMRYEHLELKRMQSMDA